MASSPQSNPPSSVQPVSEPGPPNHGPPVKPGTQQGAHSPSTLSAQPSTATSSWRRLFITAGGGTEQFAARELRQHGCTHVDATQGKIFFTSPSPMFPLDILHCAERAFVLVATRALPDVARYKPQAFQQLHDIIADLPWWPEALACWQRYQPIGVQTFRVSAKCSHRGFVGVATEEIAGHVARAVRYATGWRPDVRAAALEVYVHLSMADLIVGLALSRAPLSLKAHLPAAGLRAPVCWCLCSLAGIAPDDVVIDPTCGLGTILLECANVVPAATYIGVDISSDAVSQCVSLAAAANVSSHLTAIQGDARHLPFQSGAFTAAVGDLPFGRQHAVAGSIEVLYQHILTELARVVCPAGRAALLVPTAGIVAASLAAAASSGELAWTLAESHPVRLGDLQATMVLLQRSPGSDESASRSAKALAHTAPAPKRSRQASP